MCAYSTPTDEVNLSESQIRQWMCEVGRRLWVNQMVGANGGNLSYRLGENRVLATPTYISKGFMEPEDLVILDLQGNQLSGRRQMTSEIKMHLAIYKARSDIKAVVHAHPRHATAFAATKIPVPKCVLPEIEVFVGEVPIAPYETPGTQKFADAIVPYLADFTVILLANHGAVAVGKGIMDAYWKLEIVEAYCAVLLIARQLGGPDQVQQSRMQEILQIKERLGIPDRRIHDPIAARCDVPAPTPGLGPLPGPGPGPEVSGSAAPVSADLVERIVQAVVQRLARET